MKTQVHLYPGDHFISGEDVVISTTLGSCVSACLYDPIQRVVGMNHFLLSSRRYSQGLPYYMTDTGKYGIHAMELVINGMLALGAQKSNLQCKSFGGASLFRQTPGVDNFLCVGEVNERFIRAFLREEGIPLISEDLGGEQGRVVRFHADDFSVYVKKSNRPSMPSWEAGNGSSGNQPSNGRRRQSHQQTSGNNNNKYSGFPFYSRRFI
jgi:chemotaxis protein CheD